MLNKFKKYWDIFLLIICLLPVLCIHLNNKHDWGDDFAQYLLQAKWISHQHQSLLVSDIQSYGPAVKGILFSVILLPAICSQGNEIFYSKILVSISVLLLACIFYLILKKRAGFPVAFVLTCLLITNFHLLQLCDQIMPDFLFISFILAAAYFLQVNSLNKGLLFVLLSIGLRSAGIAACIAVLMLMVQYRFKNRELLALYLKSMIWFIPAIIAMVFFEKFLEPEKSGSLWYINLIASKTSVSQAISNLSFYKNGMFLFFEQEIPMWMNYFLRILIFPPMICGFINKLLTQPGFREWFVIVYCCLLLIYPYNNETSRFLIPVIVPGIIYFADFLNLVFNKISASKGHYGMIAFSLLLLFTNYNSTRIYLKSLPVYEPSSTSAQALFEFVKTKIPQQDKVAFKKPWALALFTNHTCVPVEAAGKSKWIVYSKSDKQDGGKLPVFENDEFIVLENQ